jgi:hypothetical protein
MLAHTDSYGESWCNVGRTKKAMTIRTRRGADLGASGVMCCIKRKSLDIYTKNDKRAER